MAIEEEYQDMAAIILRVRNALPTDHVVIFDSTFPNTVALAKAIRYGLCDSLTVDGKSYLFLGGEGARKWWSLCLKDRHMTAKQISKLVTEYTYGLRETDI